MKKKEEMRSSSNNFLNFVFDTQDAWFVLKISNNVMELCVFFKKTSETIGKNQVVIEIVNKKNYLKKWKNYYIVH